MMFGLPKIRKRFTHLGWPKQYVERIDRHLRTVTPVVGVTDTGRSVVNMVAVGNRTGTTFDHDVIIVGGGPAGCSAGVFTARADLDTAIYDRGRSSLKRCAYLENYLGFPAGIDVETLYDRFQHHAETAGCTVVSQLVESLDRTDDGEGFVVETQDGETATTRRVIAATRYDGEYMPGLDDDAAMFETHEHHGESAERFAPDYPDADGRTPVDGLYVAAPNGDRNDQVVVAAGQGAHVARSLIEDDRRDAGYPAGVVGEHYDWVRPEREFSGEWAGRERWREWFENELPADHGLGEDELAGMRESYVDRAFETRVSPAVAEARWADGVARLVETIGAERVLDALDDEAIRSYVDGR